VVSAADSLRSLFSATKYSTSHIGSPNKAMKNCVFGDVTPCGSCKNQRFGGIWSLHNQGGEVLPNSRILVILMMEALRSSKTSVLTRGTQRHNSEDGILHSHRREKLKSYIALTDWAL
jgi:hypothetical protein